MTLPSLRTTDPVRHGHDELDRVLDEDDRDPSSRTSRRMTPSSCSRTAGASPTAGSFEEKEGRRVASRAHDLDHPLLPARQLAGRLVGEMAMPISSRSRGRARRRPLGRAGRRHAEQDAEESRGHLRVETGQHVLERGQLAEETAVLKGPPDALRDTR